jgi:hypothetical protein
MAVLSHIVNSRIDTGAVNEYALGLKFVHSDPNASLGLVKNEYGFADPRPDKGTISVLVATSEPLI